MDVAIGSTEKTRWLILVYHLPREPSRHRVAVWRKLKALGAQRFAGRGRGVAD
jgi:hypothetical protein